MNRTRGRRVRGMQFCAPQGQKDAWVAVHSLISNVSYSHSDTTRFESILNKKQTHVWCDHLVFLTLLTDLNFFREVLWALKSYSSHAPLFYNSKKSLLSLYHTILQYLHISNFYFSFLLIKIIYLHNKIIYLKIISSLPSLSSLSFSALSHL